MSALHFERDLPTPGADRARLPTVQMPLLSTPLQRSDPHAFNDIRVPSDIAVLAVLWRLRYKLSFRDVAEMLLERGYELTHETVRDWEARFARCWPVACA